MDRLIYDPETKTIITRISPCDGTATGTPFSVYEGEPADVDRFVALLTAVVPKTVTATQLRLWLVTHGIALTAVDAAIAAIPDEMQRQIVQVLWQTAPYIERTHPMLIPLAAAFNLTEAQVDAAFIEAATMGE